MKHLIMSCACMRFPYTKLIYGCNVFIKMAPGLLELNNKVNKKATKIFMFTQVYVFTFKSHQKFLDWSSTTFVHLYIVAIAWKY